MSDVDVPKRAPEERIIPNGCPRCGSDLRENIAGEFCVNWLNAESGGRTCDHVLLAG